MDANNYSWVFRWTEAEGFQLLGDLEDVFGVTGAPAVYARAASHGGS